MSSKECEEQLKRLIYDWETEGLLTKINATDIEAIKHLMLENQMQQDTIKTQKIVITNSNKRIDKAIEYIENHSLYEEEYDYDYEENSYLSGIDDETAKKDLLKILRGGINE